MNTKPEALRLADELEMWTLGEPAAAELRRLNAENEALKATLNGWLIANGPNGWIEDLRKQRDELLEALRGYVNDYCSEDGMYAEKHYVRIFSEAIARAEGKQ